MRFIGVMVIHRVTTVHETLIRESRIVSRIICGTIWNNIPYKTKEP